MSIFRKDMIEKARMAESEVELAALAEKEGIELDGEKAEQYFKMLNDHSGEMADDELDNVSGGGCMEQGKVCYDPSMEGKRAYHPTSGNTYIILGPCPGSSTKALVRNVYSGDEGYSELYILSIE